MRPRVLYSALFTFFSLSGGRFTAMFLEHELGFNENWMISCAMATQILSSSLCSSWLGGLADSWEASKKGGKTINGRLLVVSIGLLLSTIATLLHSLGGLFIGIDPDDTNAADTAMGDSLQKIPTALLIYHLVLRALFSIGTAASMPAVDGLTLAQLEQDGRDKQEYGKERIYGAILWGIAHMIFGLAIDRSGFEYKILYVTTILSFLGCIIMFYMYAKSNSANQYVGVTEKGNTNEMAKTSNADEWETSPDRAVVTMTKHSQRRKKYKSKTSFQDNETFDNDEAITITESVQERLNSADLIRLLFQKSPILNSSFIIALFALFIGMAVVENLIFLYFEFLGGSDTMCGLTVALTVAFEIPLFQFSADVLKMLGTQKLFLCGCFAYVVRVVGYSFVPLSHPYLVLFLEPLHGVTIAAAISSSVAFADDWVPQGYEASGQGFMSMVRGLGQFVGLCIGGYLEGRTLYRVLAAIVTLGSMILGIGTCLATKPLSVTKLSRDEENQSRIHGPKHGPQIVEII